MDTGRVYYWDNFQLGNRSLGHAKNRYLICVGRTPLTDPEAFFFAVTTTTQIHHYMPGGSRNPQYFRAYEHKAWSHIFRENCGIDFKEKVIPISADYYQRSSVREIGSMPTEEMRIIYDNIVSARSASPYQTCDIASSLERLGLSGLQRPRTRGR